MVKLHRLRSATNSLVSCSRSCSCSCSCSCYSWINTLICHSDISYSTTYCDRFYHVPCNFFHILDFSKIYIFMYVSYFHAFRMGNKSRSYKFRYVERKTCFFYPPSLLSSALTGFCKMNCHDVFYLFIYEFRWIPTIYLSYLILFNCFQKSCIQH